MLGARPAPDSRLTSPHPTAFVPRQDDYEADPRFSASGFAAGDNTPVTERRLDLDLPEARVGQHRRDFPARVLLARHGHQHVYVERGDGKGAGAVVVEEHF